MSSDPVGKNLPSNAGDVGLIPGWETKIPHTVWQLSQGTTTREATYCNESSHIPQLRFSEAK